MGRGGSVEKEGARVKRASHNIYNLFRVSLFHSDEIFHVYACTGSAFFQIRPTKRPVIFFKNDHKKLFSLQNVMKKIVLNVLLLKKLSATPKNGNPPNKKIMVHP